MAMDIRPDPTEAEAAAIAAALILAWPQPAVDDRPPDTSNRWRFSGRWWHHNPRRRRRP